jgi:hypothetical protein
MQSRRRRNLVEAHVDIAPEIRRWIGFQGRLEYFSGFPGRQHHRQGFPERTVKPRLREPVEVGHTRFRVRKELAREFKGKVRHGRGQSTNDVQLEAFHVNLAEARKPQRSINVSSVVTRTGCRVDHL